MPHVIVEYSGNLEPRVDIAGLCEVLRAAAAGQEIFPEDGVRVRALRAEHYAIADAHPDNAFIDISVRLRGGRALEARKAATEAIFEAARAFLADVIAIAPIMLSLEMRDIDPDLSPKLNTIRDRMEKEAGHG